MTQPLVKDLSKIFQTLTAVKPVEDVLHVFYFAKIFVSKHIKLKPVIASQSQLYANHNCM